AKVYDDMSHAGYIDTYGKESTGFKYTYAGQFNRYGYAVVGKGDADEMKFGVINTRGDEIIPVEHDFVLPFADEKTGIAADLPEKSDDPISKYTLFSLSNGEQKPLDLGWRNKLRLTSPIDGDIAQEILSEHSLMIFETNSVIGLMDHEANVIVDARYENIYQIPKEKLPDDVICVFERYGKRCTLNDDYEINEYVTAKMMDPDPTQQILLELAGFEPIYTGTGEDVRFTQINKDGELFADLSSLDTPKAIATADGYLYIVGYEQNSDGGYTTIRKILDKNGRELNIPEHCVLSYNYLWGAY
ncbi:MAG: WG repeat-containing protein, partial [Oscillospiraceae bacterium]|nr:WG repeat-containing protein [Oscillospiraceae bacterium]